MEATKPTALLLCSGLIASLLLPIGIIQGFGLAYDAVLSLHLIVQLAAVIFSVKFVVQKLRGTPLSLLTLVALFLLFVIEIFATGLPITATDSLIHHMAVPKWWVENNSINAIPWHEWSYYPMLANLAFISFIKWGQECAAGAYILSYFVILVAITGGITERITKDSLASALAIIVTATLPVWLKLAAVPMVDMPLACFAAAAAFFLVRYFTSEAPKNYDALMAGAALGLCSATKYNGCLYAVFFLLAWFVVALQQKKDRVALLKGCIFAALVCGVVFSPWGIKNYLWTGNPVYPLMKSTFGGLAPILQEMPKQLPPLVHRSVIYGESWLEILLLPFRIFISGKDGVPQSFDGVLTPLLLLFVLTLALSKGERARSLLGIISVGYLLAAVVFSQTRIRYLAPVIPLFVVLCAAAPIFTNKYRLSIFKLCLVFQVIWGGFYAWKSIAQNDLIPIYGQTVSREQYLTQNLSDYPLIEYVNQNLSDDSKVYLLQTSNHFYYFNKKILSRGFYSASELLAWLRRKKDIQAEFASLNVTHLFLHTERFKKFLTETLNPEELTNWNKFNSEHLTLIQSLGEYSLWKIL